MKMNDQIVEEMRKYGTEFAVRYNNNIAEMCKALKSKEKELDVKVVNRPPHYVQKRIAS